MTILATKTEALLKKGCRAYVALISEAKPELVSMENVDVVRNFSYVFLEELPGFPLDIEIEFSIELVLGTASISKAPYRMAPSELVSSISNCRSC